MAILHIPHSSKAIPEEFRNQFIIDDNSLVTELLRMTDSFADELFGGLQEAVIFPVSRLVVDPERFVDDAEEPMYQKGMGVIYTLTHDGKPLRRAISAMERTLLLNRYYHPHHAALTLAVQAELNDKKTALIFDCHSFPSVPLPYEDDQSVDRPQVCIGTDSFHTPTALRQFAYDHFSSRGFTVALNHPFAGTLVPAPYYHSNQSVHSLMIEVRRDLYMNEHTGQKKDEGFANLRTIVQDFLDDIA
jgi:N-formylglutamate deformylase